MANKFNKFLGDMLNGFLDPKGNLGDYQHASRLYVDDTFRLAPKNKFLYYVVFNLNSNALVDTSFQDRHNLELNYLVKSTDLPKFTLNTETLNQYNRKSNIYTKITYDPVNITFHDDNNGVTNMLWSMYYGYYFNDRHNAMDPYSDVSPIAYKASPYLSKEYTPYRYGMDTEDFNGSSGTSEPFFLSIQLVTMSRQRFFSYLLCNPKITKWDHDTMSQSEGGGIVENKMTVAYEAVIYNSGAVDVDDPSGFAVLHYDNTPSPIAGDEILQNGIAGIFGDVFGMNDFASPLSYLTTARPSVSPYVNLGNTMSYGYGSNTFTNSYGYPVTTGGLQNYGFGGMGVSPTTALTIAGIGIGANLASNVLKGVFSNNGSRIENNNNETNGVATPTQPGGDNNAPAQDAYSPPGFRNEAAADAAAAAASERKTQESLGFNGGEAGSRSDRLDNGSTGSLQDTQQADSQTYGGYSSTDELQQFNTQTAAEASDQGGGSYQSSDFGQEVSNYQVIPEDGSAIV
jgi:hypothetical protein